MSVSQTSLPARMRAFVSLGRPLFLVGGFVFHTLGAVAALYAGHNFSLTAFIVAQVTITATQWMTHYSNDYFDVEVDRLNPTPTRWSGGSRILIDEQLRPRTALVAARVLTGVAIMAAIVLALLAGPLAGGLALLTIVAAWEYSAPPLRLTGSGFGELAATLTITGLTPLVGYGAQAGALSWLVVLAIIPLNFLQFAMLLTVAFPDAQGDAIAGKGTLVVRLGGQRAARVHNASLALAYLTLPALVLLGLPPLVTLAMGVTAPVALWQAWRVSHGAWGDTRKQASIAFWGIGLLIVTGALALAAFVVLSLP